MSFSTLHDPSPAKETPVDKPSAVGYNVQVDEDDLDDLFDKQGKKGKRYKFVIVY